MKSINDLKTSQYLLLILPVILMSSGLTACLSAHERFFMAAVDHEAKSKFIVGKGIALYNAFLAGDEDYRKLAEIKQYFEVALAFNAKNKEADLYLEKIKSYVKTKVADNLATAKKYQSKKDRSDADNFSMCYAVNHAYALAPQDAEVRRLSRETAAIQTELVKNFLEKSKSLVTAAKKDDSADAKEKKYLSALDYNTKVLKLAPQNTTGQSDKVKLIKELTVLFEQKYRAAVTKLAQKNFTEAEQALKNLKDLNTKLDDSYAAKLADLSYQLYFQWAGAYFKQANYALADNRIRLALAVYQSEEAAGLRDKITVQAGKNNATGSFDDALRNIDTLLTQKNWPAVTSAIQYLKARTADTQKLQQLKLRQDRLREQLAAIYKQGIRYYQEENYKKVIEVLGTVVSIDAGYEQAATYLEKARVKQKVLEEGF